MIFVDTNYFLRFLLRDSEGQYLEAKELLLEAAAGRVVLLSSTVVFFEVAWVLRFVYKKDKSMLAQTLHKLLNLNIQFGDHKMLLGAVNLFIGSNFSLEDCYNLEFARQYKAANFKTFDKRLSKYFESLVH